MGTYQANLHDEQTRYLNRTHKSHLTPKFIEGCDLCESYGETSYVFPQNTLHLIKQNGGNSVFT